ncbi:hypothetical protein ABK040_016821 [Willaertia magna]
MLSPTITNSNNHTTIDGKTSTSKFHHHRRSSSGNTSQNQIVKFNVGGKIFYTTRETINNSVHLSTQQDSNCSPFSQLIRSTSSSSLSQNNKDSSPIPISTDYSSLSTLVDFHYRKNRKSIDSTASIGSSNTNSISNLSPTYNTTSPFLENYFTKLLDENNHVGILKDESGCYFIDRNPKYFAILLEYLKTGELELIGSYPSSEFDTPEYGFHDLQLFTQKIIKEADYFLIDISDQIYNIVSDQIYVNESFHERTVRNQRTLLFFDKDPLKKPCSLFLNGIFLDKLVVDKECFVRNGVIECYFEENVNEGIRFRKKSLRKANANKKNVNIGSDDSPQTEGDESSQKRKSIAPLDSSLLLSTSNTSSSHGMGSISSSNRSAKLKLQFVIYPQVEVKKDERKNMMNYIGMDTSLLIEDEETNGGQADQLSLDNLLYAYGQRASRRISMEFPHLVDNVLVVKDVQGFKREFRLKEMVEPPSFKLTFNKMYYNLSDYNHSVKILKDDKDKDYVTVVECLIIPFDKLLSTDIKGDNTPPTSLQRTRSDLSDGVVNGSGLASSSNTTNDTHYNFINNDLLYNEIGSSDSDEDEFSVPQASVKRKSLAVLKTNNKVSTLRGTPGAEQTKETRMKIIRNNFFAKSKKEFIYVESKNRIYWVSRNRGLLTLELSNKNL